MASRNLTITVRPAEAGERCCGSCGRFEDGKCLLAGATVAAGETCDAWAPCLLPRDGRQERTSPQESTPLTFRELEWSRSFPAPSCPHCKGDRRDGHQPGCRMHAAVQAETEVAGRPNDLAFVWRSVDDPPDRYGLGSLDLLFVTLERDPPNTTARAANPLQRLRLAQYFRCASGRGYWADHGDTLALVETTGWRVTHWMLVRGPVRTA